MFNTTKSHPLMHRQKLFTLIELLVVIAIIAILASMLLPALGRARDKAKEISCRSLISQMSKASMQYELDSDSWLPALNTNSSGSLHINQSWVYQVRPYLGNPVGSGYAYPAKMFCPKASLALSPESASNTYPGCYDMGKCFAINREGYPSYDPTRYRSIKSASVRRPSSKFQFLDATDWLASYLRADYSSYYAVKGEFYSSSHNNVPAYRHFGSFNASYLDGHVGSCNWKEAWNGSSGSYYNEKWKITSP